MTAHRFIIQLHQLCRFYSRERKGLASNSEIKRWIMNRSVIMNGEAVEWNEEMDFTIDSLVLFPKGRTVTLK